MAKGRNNKAKIQTFIERDDVSIVANIEENCILTTEDKIKISYNEYNEARKYSGEFCTFGGLFIALLTAIVTSDFKSVFGVPPNVVEATFILATALSFVLTIWALIQWIRHHKKLSFEYFINQIRGNNVDE